MSNPPSAFPSLPRNPDELPEIPGGWTEAEFTLAGRTLKLQKPKDPDLFLEDAQVHSENVRHDYMPYWAFLWPAAVQMAQAVLDPEWPVGTPVLEVGSGLGLVGLAALLRGDRVTFSDYDRTALHLCRLNSRQNQLGDPQLLWLDWRDPPQRQYPVIIGCEVTYEASLHQPLLNLLQTMLAPTGICWLADPGRYQSVFFQEKAEEAGFEIGPVRPRGLENVSNFQLLRLRHRAAGGSAG